MMSSSIDTTDHWYSYPLLALNDTWLLPIFTLCLCGFLLTMILSFVLICLSFRRLNGHFLLTNLFICFSVCFIYVIIILFLLRANEFFCGLREFLSQLAYALLYSAFLCRYIMQWLGPRLLSQRTKQLTSLLIYILLILIQIPIGILWWYFTVPRQCQEGKQNILSSKSTLPPFEIRFDQGQFSSVSSCSNSCRVDYRFYATFTYTIIELLFSTIIASCLFFCRHCHRRRRTDQANDKSISINGNNALLTFLNMFALILIDLVWLSWTCIYYFTHPFYIFPALICGMFLIATIALVFVLCPQLYYYSKFKPNPTGTSSILQPTTKTTLYSNKLAAADGATDEELLLDDQSAHRNQKRKEQTLSNGSDLSCELGASGTFLPITRTPKGPFKVKPVENPPATTPSDKLDQLIYGEQSKQESSLVPPVPLQRQLTSSSIASDFVTPVTKNVRYPAYRNPNSGLRTSSSMFYSSPYSQVRRDETLIPILCNTERPRTSTPVQMRYLVHSPSSSVPTTRRIHSGSDLRYVRHPHPPPPPPAYYSPQLNQQYLFVDPYRTVPSRLGGNTWHSVLLQPGPTSLRHPYPPRRFYAEQRSLSQRLWDIDSGDDEEDVEEDIIKVAGRVTPAKERLNDFPSTQENILLHIDDETEDDSYGKQYAHV